MPRRIFPALASLLLLTAACSGTPGDDDDDTSPGITDQDQDGVAAPDDCDDQDASVFPNAAESCDGVDNNCNSQIDEGFSLTPYFPDLDGDGFGDEDGEVRSCVAPAGYIADGGDCDDGNASIHPEAFEVTCNGQDETCSGLTADHPDLDADGYDTCPAGVSGADAAPADCNDASNTVHPNAGEICNNTDDNCNGELDDGLPSATYYQDSDGDGFGDAAQTTTACAPPPGYVEKPGDCDDTDRAVNPNGQDSFDDGTDGNCNGYQDVIFTWAGTGTKGSSGDAGPASIAQLNAPGQVHIDPLGNLFVADTANHRIRRIDTTGIIVTVAGNGQPGVDASSIGDGGPATLANLDSPVGVIVDATGNLFIADTLHHRIRKVQVNPGSPTGFSTITTVAGTGEAGYLGEATPASAAQLNRPHGLAVDLQNNLYVADTGNHRIRKVGKSGSPSPQAPLTINTVAGPVGELEGYAGGYGGDGGPATAAWLKAPEGVTIDSTGALYIADTGNHRVRRVTLQGIIQLEAGNGTAGYGGDEGQASVAQLNFPAAIATDLQKNVYIADSANHVVRMITVAGKILTVAGTSTAGYNGDAVASVNAMLDTPLGVSVGPQGNLAIVDSENHRVRMVLW